MLKCEDCGREIEMNKYEKRIYSGEKWYGKYCRALCYVRKLSRELKEMEVMEEVRLGEGAVLKTVGCKSFGGSSPPSSAIKKTY